MPQNQNAKMLAMLKRYPNEWVAMPRIAAEINGYAVHSRSADLNRMGHHIENRVEIARDGQKHSFYRLVTPQPVSSRPTPIPTQSGLKSPVIASETAFQPLLPMAGNKGRV